MLRLNLRFFDGGAGDGAGASSGAEGAATGLNASAEAIPGAQVSTDKGDERLAAYEKFKGENKDLFSADFNKQLDARFKSAKHTEARLNEVNPVLQALEGKYGTKPGDVPALLKAIESDTAYFEQEAEERGMTVEQLKHVKTLESELARRNQEEADRQRDEARDRKLTEWNDQAEKAKAVYPQLDLLAEMNDPQTGERFFKLMASGLIDVQTAYETVHPEQRDARITAASGMIAKMTQQQTLDTIRARGMRPAENGLHSTTPASLKKDVSKLTREERDDLARRALRGEAIEL
ncbi:MAG TPA: hypothetical protein PLP25_02945 [Candidatus Limiplasma sp.]|nr:hypothetical protein [Candidatus Limiplasma sp.]HPS80805.1 hypothetical protein [Candidatus Limiplasma sp.]